MDFLIYNKQFSSKLTEKLPPQNIYNEPQKRQLGVFPKGTFSMSEDFNELLDCFKEYSR